MTLDTFAYAKRLHDGGLEPEAIEAHTEAMTKHILPALATKADLVELKHEITWRMFTITLAVVGTGNAMLFFALRYLPSP